MRDHDDHGHVHAQAHVHAAPAAADLSVLAMSAVRRMALAAAPLTLLWLAVWWAVAFEAPK